MLVWSAQPGDSDYGWNTQANCDKDSLYTSLISLVELNDDDTTIDLIFAQETAIGPAWLQQMVFNGGLSEVGRDLSSARTHTFKWNYIKDLWQLLGTSDEMEFVDDYKRESFSMIYAPWLCDDAFRAKTCTAKQILDLYTVDLMQVANSLDWKYDYSFIAPEQLACGVFNPDIVP